jgi:anti-sigma factor RsiW
MNCKTARGLFSLRLDEGLSYEEQRALTHHLDRCPGCAGELRKLERTVGLVRGLPEILPPDMFVQDVLRAARQVKGGAAIASSPSFGERLRDFVSGLEWLRSPRFAPAALALGLVVGVTASVLILHPHPAVEIAQQLPASSPKTTGPAVAVAPTAAPIVGPASIPVASGPFEELVAQMKDRLEADTPGVAEDTTGSMNFQWGPTRDGAGIGQQVGAGPSSPTSGNRRGGRVYVVF